VLAAAGWHGADPVTFPDVVPLLGGSVRGSDVSLDVRMPPAWLDPEATDPYLVPGSRTRASILQIVQGRPDRAARDRRPSSRPGGLGPVVARAARPVGRLVTGIEGAPAGPVGPAEAPPLPPEYVA